MTFVYFLKVNKYICIFDVFSQFKVNYEEIGLEFSQFGYYIVIPGKFHYIIIPYKP